MASLGDFFGDAQKDAFAQQSVKVGSVVKVWLTTTTPPKEKRILIVGTTAVGDYLGVVLINSEINWNVHRNPDMYDFQYFLRAEDCSFLDHDSYADCTQIHVLSQAYVTDEVRNDLQKALGEVATDLFTDILSRVKNAPTISLKTLKRFGLRD